jgi:hypothetical protein
MVVRTRRILPALLVLLVLFASQAAYAAGAFERPSGHCASSAPPEHPCRLPLWLTCCDDHAAVPVGTNPHAPRASLVLPLETALVSLLAAGDAPIAARVRVPPDTPSRLSAVLQL